MNQLFESGVVAKGCCGAPEDASSSLVALAFSHRAAPPLAGGGLLQAAAATAADKKAATCSLHAAHLPLERWGTPPPPRLHARAARRRHPPPPAGRSTPGGGGGRGNATGSPSQTGIHVWGLSSPPARRRCRRRVCPVLLRPVAPAAAGGGRRVGSWRSWRCVRCRRSWWRAQPRRQHAGVAALRARHCPLASPASGRACQRTLSGRGRNPVGGGRTGAAAAQHNVRRHGGMLR